MDPFPPFIMDVLLCPICKGKILVDDKQFRCARTGCEQQFPIIDGIPILIDEEKSVARFLDYDHRPEKNLIKQNPFKKIISRFTPSKSLNFQSEKNYSKFTALMTQKNNMPCVLVVGGRKLGCGISPLIDSKSIYVLETDITYGSRTKLICDAHNLPFEDQSFEAVVIQAVLEHVVDPTRCVQEIHRVLIDGGLVYAETPFLQEVHEFPYDFTRFTSLGHRRLFRNFSEIDSGPVAGPATVLT